jgi:hypothetical protein
MTFEQILPALKQGKKVRRKGWKKEEYIYARSSSVSAQECWWFNDEEGHAMCTMNPSVIFADDWEIYGEENQNGKSGVSIGCLKCKVSSNFDECEQALDKFKCRLEDLREAAEELNGIKLDINIDFD